MGTNTKIDKIKLFKYFRTLLFGEPVNLLFQTPSDERRKNHPVCERQGDILLRSFENGVCDCDGGYGCSGLSLYIEE